MLTMMLREVYSNLIGTDCNNQIADSRICKGGFQEGHKALFRESEEK